MEKQTSERQFVDKQGKNDPIEQNENKQNNKRIFCHPIISEIFNTIKTSFQIHEIEINKKESLFTIYIPAINQNNKQTTFYLGHGFGGSSLMYFPIINYLLNYGAIVLWQIRGMGLSTTKLKKYYIKIQQAEDFFVNPIQLMLEHYQHKDIIFISHSLSAYLTLLYVMKFKAFRQYIRQVILLSPVGLTPKQQDRNNKIQGFQDFMVTVGNHISWTFGLTYKSPFRKLCPCLMQKVFTGAVKDCDFTDPHKTLMKDLLISLVGLSDGSESVFFKYFLPRVLPVYPIQPRMVKSPKVNIKILYGQEEDWVDKSGAQKLKNRFPKRIELILVKQTDHNFPFFPNILIGVLQQILSYHKRKKIGQGKSILKPIKSKLIVEQSSDKQSEKVQ